MGCIQNLPPVKLFSSIFSQDINIIDKSKKELIKKLGPIDYESKVLDFNYTTYYENEFGNKLKRIFVSFKKLIPSDQLWRIKIQTNKIEEGLKFKEKRQVNIDPGYISQANLILATTKPYSHRIYIEKGIYQEVTMIFQDSTFQPLPWTYPDYQDKENIETFLSIRSILNQQLK